jgi:hypothetical protein
MLGQGAQYGVDFQQVLLEHVSTCARIPSCFAQLRIIVVCNHDDPGRRMSCFDLHSRGDSINLSSRYHSVFALTYFLGHTGDYASD